MEIYWDNIPECCEKLLTGLITRGLHYVGAPHNSEISISFVNQDEIRILNRDYRNIDKETDVLSFPFTDPKDWQNKSDMPLALGDIIICMPVAQAQAETYGHSLGRELGFLTIHGLLHLAGYDHMEPEEEERMRQAQREILEEMQ